LTFTPIKIFALIFPRTDFSPSSNYIREACYCQACP